MSEYIEADQFHEIASHIGNSDWKKEILTAIRKDLKYDYIGPQSKTIDCLEPILIESFINGLEIMSWFRPTQMMMKGFIEMPEFQGSAAKIFQLEKIYFFI